MKGHSVHIHRPNLHLPLGETLISLVTFGAVIGVVLLGVSVLEMSFVRPLPNDAAAWSIPTTANDVQLIVNHAPALNLTPNQSREINGINTAWLAEKRRIEVEMWAAESAAHERMKGSRGEYGVSLNAMVAETRTYTELTEEYCTKRLDHWRQAMSYLTASQREKLQKDLGDYL